MNKPRLNFIQSACSRFLASGLLGVIAACTPVKTVPPPSPGTSSYQPVTIDNCGITTTYQNPPSRVVTMNQASTEIMLALGLEAQMIGTADLDDEILPEYQSVYAQIPRIAKNYPSREVLLGVEPDFVYAGQESAFSSEYGVGSQAELVNLGINSYLSPMECMTLSLRPKTATIADVHNEIREIGRIFGVEERAEQLIAAQQAQLQAVQAKLQGLPTPKQIFWYDSEDPPVTISCCGIPNYIVEAAGGQNIFQDIPGQEAWVNVNWEEVVVRHPDVMVLIDANWSPAAEKRQLLLNNPAYAQMKAVQQQQFIVLDFNYSTPGIRNAAAVQKLAQALYPERFKE